MLAIVKVKNSEIIATYFVYRLVYTYNIYLYTGFQYEQNLHFHSVHSSVS